MSGRRVTVLWVGSAGAGLQGVAGAADVDPELDLVRVAGVAEARAAGVRDPPALVFAEPVLPDGDAGDVAAALPETPVILVTDDPDAEPCRRALGKGAFDWLRLGVADAAEWSRAVARGLRVRDLLRAKVRAERELRQKQDIFEEVTRSTGVGVALISRDFRTLWANEQVSENFGQVIGRLCHEAYNRRADVCPGCGVREVFATGQARVIHEQLGFDVQGDEVWSQIVASPIRDDRGEVVAAVEVVLPITDRKRAEEALKEREAQHRRLYQEFNAVLDAIPDNLTLQSPDLRILWANRGAAENLGGETADLVGRHCYEVWQCRAEPCESCPVRRCFETRASTMECVLTPEQRAWELRAVPIHGEDGEVTSVVEVGREITAHREAELDRERLIRELESKNSELEDFTHTVSHDLKSPLTTIRGFANLLLRELDDGRVDQVRAHGKKIAAAGERMQQLLDELLELSRAGRLAGARGPVPLAEVVQEALSNLAGLIAEREVRVEVAPGLPTVRGDRLRLREVFENLLNNSIKFLGRQPDPRVEIGARSEASGPVFFVRDNGIGIDAEDRQHIFGLFRKLDSETEGTGVGLAIVKRIVEGHGGNVWVESDGPGRGSTFCFTLGGGGDA